MSDTDRSAPAWLRILAILLALLVVLVAFSRARALLHPAADEIAHATPACDLQAGACRARFADGLEIELDIAPRPITTAHTLTFRVAQTGPAVDVQPVALSFSSPDMNMGRNRLALTQHAAGQYRGTGMLPVCVTQRMTWYADVIVAGPPGRRAARFDFETTR